MNFKHGMSGTPTYKSWAEMKYRCDHAQGNYKGVKYCKRWADFNCFIEDMGERPKGTSLDRINVYGNYEPNNCRWADDITQANNKTTNKYYDIEGELLTLSQIARKYGISRSNLANKIYIYKMDIKEAIAYLLQKKGERTYRRKKNVR